MFSKLSADYAEVFGSKMPVGKCKEMTMLVNIEIKSELVKIISDAYRYTCEA